MARLAMVAKYAEREAYLRALRNGRRYRAAIEADLHDPTSHEKYEGVPEWDALSTDDDIEQDAMCDGGSAYMAVYPPHLPLPQHVRVRVIPCCRSMRNRSRSRRSRTVRCAAKPASTGDPDPDPDPEPPRAPSACACGGAS